MDQNQTVIATFNKKATKQDQTITFAALGGKTYGDADFGVSATASSNLPVTFTASGQCTVTSGIVHISAAGSCTMTAQQAGNASYNPAPDVARSFTIAKAESTTVVSCQGGPFTYTGQAQTPCTVAVTGAGGLSLTPAPTYANNTDAGTATASYTYAGDANHSGSSDSKNFTIDKASSTTVVTIVGGPFTYTGLRADAGTVTVTGAGG